MKKIYAVGLSLLVLFLLSGCGMKAWSKEDMLECNEGKYDLPEDIEKESYLNDLEDIGTGFDYIRVTRDGGNCTATIVLTEPIVIFGSEIRSFDMATCDIGCMEEKKDTAPCCGLSEW